MIRKPGRSAGHEDYSTVSQVRGRCPHLPETSGPLQQLRDIPDTVCMVSKQQSNGRLAEPIAILGGGNIGQAMANGFVAVGGLKPSHIHLTRRQAQLLRSFAKRGFAVTSDNAAAVNAATVVVLAVQPGQLFVLLDTIRDHLDPKKHVVLSAVTGVPIVELEKLIGKPVPIIRVMPNTAVAIGESMTCLAANGRTGQPLKLATQLFDRVGRTLLISEEQMTPATALCACGIAFFLRSIRAASQGGIEIGFHAEEALRMAAQTARGAATLLLQDGPAHPEAEIDKVTTPRGCTIAGLNRMEHEGFSSAMIKGLVTSTRIAGGLFHSSDD